MLAEERADTVLLTSVYPQAAPVLSSALGTPRTEPGDLSQLSPLLGQLCWAVSAQSTTEALGYVEICLGVLLVPQQGDSDVVAKHGVLSAFKRVVTAASVPAGTSLIRNGLSRAIKCIS